MDRQEELLRNIELDFEAVGSALLAFRLDVDKIFTNIRSADSTLIEEINADNEHVNQLLINGQFDIAYLYIRNYTEKWAYVFKDGN